jgi:CHAT domain-containing protein/tetratricopeptide (TPR) repeat protein
LYRLIVQSVAIINGHRGKRFRDLTRILTEQIDPKKESAAVILRIIATAFRGRRLFWAALAAGPLISIAFPLAAQDPTGQFIAMADSLARTAPPESLAAFVAGRSILAGAAVCQLLDAGVSAGDQGQKDAERENIALAGRVAALYRDATGSAALLDLVASYRAWGADARSLRRNAKALEKEASAAQAEKRFDDAIALFQRSAEIYRRIGDRYSEAVVGGSLGVAAFYKGDFKTVREFYRSALEARRRIENYILVGRTLNGLGTAALMLEDYRESVDYYRQAIDLRRKTGDIGGLGTSLTYLGNAYTQLGRLADARDVFEEALVIVERSGNQKQRLELLNSIAGLQSDMGRIRESNESYRKALDMAMASGDAQAEIVCRMNIALNLKGAFRYREALAELDRVEALLAKNPDAVQGVLLHRNRGQIYVETGELDRARDDLLAYLAKARENGMEAQEIEAMVKLGYLYLELQAFDRGLVLADSARARAEKAGNRPFIREANLLAAQLEQSRGNAAAALAHYERALERDRADGAERDALQDELGVANATALEGRGADARRVFFALEPRIRAAGMEDLLLTLNLGVGHSFEREDPDSARFYYGRALDLMERARADIGGAELGSSYLGGLRRHYSEEIARYYARVARETGERRWIDEAFRTIERAKARGLLDLLEGSLVHEPSDAERAALDSIYRLDSAAPGYSDEQRRLERRYQRIRDERISSAAGSLDERVDVADLEQVRKALPKGTALFAFAAGDSVSLLWAADRNGAALLELPARSVLRDDVAMLSSALVNPGGGDAALRRYARKLFLSLLAPGNEFLGRNSRLVIVPDDCLFEIPFEALLTEETGTETAWEDCAFLAKSRLISYAPSGAVYMKLRRSAAASFAIELLAAGDPAYGAAGDTTVHALRRLPYSRGEVEGIGSSFKPEKRLLLLGGEATEARLKAALRERRPRLLHLAAHGIVDPVNPAASCIALLPDSAGREDGLLHTLEILSLPLSCRLVTLSACESARGRIGRGEGVVGLSRAFLAAGASCVVSSLWAVSDESTSLLMRAFYKSMVHDERSAVTALNEARLELMRTSGYEHPFYWAPFIAVGSERAPW